MAFDTELQLALLLSIPLVFLVIVVPLWLVLHYISKARAAKALSRADEETLAELWMQSEKLERRIETLEIILDREAPGWRTRS